jgi:sirohydrochlorin ferrochelatase
MTTALLLIAHGSRREPANADLNHLAQQLRERRLYPIIECGYLELAEPTIQKGADRCVAEGADRVLMVPYFLSAGVHVDEDLKQIRRELQMKYPRVEFRLCEPLGRHPLLVDIVTDRVHQADT